MNRPSEDQCPQTILRSRSAARDLDHGYSPGAWVPGGLSLEGVRPRAIAHAREHVDDRAVAVGTGQARRPRDGRRTCCAALLRAAAGELALIRACCSAAGWPFRRQARMDHQPANWRSVYTSGCRCSQPSSSSRSSANSTRCKSGLTLRCSASVHGQSPAATGRGCPARSPRVHAANAPGAGSRAIRRRGSQVAAEPQPVARRVERSRQQAARGAMQPCRSPIAQTAMPAPRQWSVRGAASVNGGMGASNRVPSSPSMS